MIKLWIVTLWTCLIASDGVTECFSGGKIYTMQGNRVIRAVTTKQKFHEIDSMFVDLDLIAKEKKRIIEIIKTKPCK